MPPFSITAEKRTIIAAHNAARIVDDARIADDTEETEELECVMVLLKKENNELKSRSR